MGDELFSLVGRMTERDSWPEMGRLHLWGGVCTAVSTVIGIIDQFWQITVCNGIEL
jgi:hypothetical protein